MPLPAALEVSILNAFELIKPVVSAGCLILTILYLSRRCLALNYEIPSPGQLDLHSSEDSQPTSHDQHAKKIASSVKDFYQRKAPFRIYHGTTCSTRTILLSREHIVDTSQLSRVLQVDQGGKYALVEPNVTIYQLVAATLRYGMIPKVVMEFPEVTAGGAFSGASGNSSCFRYGLFEQTVDWIEIVLADGSIVTASPQERADLFYGTAGTFGTLGVVTLLRVQCIAAQPFIELSYLICSGADAALTKLEEESQKVDVDYIDGIVFEKDLALVMSGRLVNKTNSDATVIRFASRADPWFCNHARQIADAGTPTTILVPLVDYLFRYDRGAFWGGQVAFSFIVQDLAVPAENTSRFLHHVEQAIGCYPIWLCPVTNLHHKEATFTSSAASKDLAHPERLVDVGLYGVNVQDPTEFRRINRSLEHELHKCGGQKALFAASYYTWAEFTSIYAQEWYCALRKKYNATTLPTVFEKMQNPVVRTTESDPHNIWNRFDLWFWNTRPLPGFYGLWMFLSGAEYLLHTTALTAESQDVCLEDRAI